ncbi:TIGR04283 family arsenosugar biosynthesis glycosyltransferase [Phormidesmis priestleyi]|uniref:TIGR04283 family arsenosugar biosynthesis glycosyltransferase n=1 Tax=Phormidesmis priestleyi TaxID=268141 RepID=UPI0009F9487C|nr:TIGR04283 family arsenosugar biosynthesis glycosyltransferase [Phormidesmis priestleyi]
MTETISIIIPVLNEAHQLSKILHILQQALDVEIIVIDGGSQDQTLEIAKRAGVKIIQSPIGRAHQMNAGVADATGDILLFLHADTRLPRDFDLTIRDTLSQSTVIAGAFRLKIDAPGWKLRVIEWGVNARSRYLQMPYGDQAIFLKTTTFQALGGFPNLPIMEDFELVRQLKRQGRIAIASTAVITSGRRWQKLGAVRTTLINQCVILAYLLGVSPDRVAQWYRSGMKRLRK